MQNSQFQLILTEPNGNFATPDIEITDDLETTFSIQSAADITKRRDTITKSISFPGTKNNNRIFNNLYSFNRDADSDLDEVLYFNYSPVIGVRAVLYENNYPLVSGTLTINDITKDKATGAYTYTGIITGNLVNFFGKVKDTLLEDLNIFNQNVNYTWDTIRGTWVYSDAQVFILPSIDYGKGITPNRGKMDLRNFRPGIYVRLYIKRILEFYGYKYKSTLLDSDLFKRMYVPFTEQDFGKRVAGNFYTLYGATRPSKQLNKGSVSEAFTGLFYDNYVANEYLTVSVQTLRGINAGWNRSNVSNNQQATVFKFNKPAFTGAIIDYAFDVYLHGEDGGRVDIQLFDMIPVTYLGAGFQLVTTPYGFDGDNPITSKTTGFSEATRNQWVRVSGSLALPVANYDKDYDFALVITSSPAKQGGVDFRQIDTKIAFGNPDATVGSIFSYNLGDIFNLKDAIPRGVKVTDFLKSIFTLFNIYLIENPEDDKELIIESYDLFYSKTNAPAKYALDWTKKVDNSSLHITINTALPKSYNFKFKEDSDFYNTLYKSAYGVGYGDLSIDNKIGTASSQDITTLFAATPIVTENKDDKTMPAIWKGDLLNKSSFKASLRLLYNNGTGACLPYDITLTKGTNESIVYEDKVTGVSIYNKSHHILNIDGTSIFNLVFGLPKAVYYTVTAEVFNVPTLYDLFRDQLIELDDINIFTLKLDCHLRDFDISALDLTRPIFISTVQGMAYFKIMSVTYFNSQELANVVLQKIVFKEELPAAADPEQNPDPTDIEEPIPNPNPTVNTYIQNAAIVKGGFTIDNIYVQVVPGSSKTLSLGSGGHIISRAFINPSNPTESVDVDIVINGVLYDSNVYNGAIYSLIIYTKGAAIIPVP